MTAWNKVEKELRTQGFQVTPTTNGVAVLNPETGQQHMFHPKTLDHKPQAVFRDLKAIGYTDPTDRKRQERVARKRMPGHYLCADPICGCGRDFPYPQNLGRHLASVRDRQEKALLDETMPPPKSEILRPSPPDEIRRARKMVKQLREISGLTAEMADLLETVLVENSDLKRKMRKVEELFGKALDEL